MGFLEETKEDDQVLADDLVQFIKEITNEWTESHIYNKVTVNKVDGDGLELKNGLNEGILEVDSCMDRLHKLTTYFQNCDQHVSNFNQIKHTFFSNKRQRPGKRIHKIWKPEWMWRMTELSNIH